MPTVERPRRRPGSSAPRDRVSGRRSAAGAVPGEGSRSRARRRRRILVAAGAAFGARPFHLVSMDDVAAAASVGKGTLYRYFPSKDDLHLALIEEAFDLLVGRLEAEQGVDLPPSVALGRMLESIVDTFARHLPFFRLLEEGQARLLLRRKHVLRSRRERIATLLGDVLARGVTAGEFRKVDAVLGPAMLIGMVWGTTLNHAHERPAEILAARVTDLALNGLLADGRGTG